MLQRERRRLHSQCRFVSVPSVRSPARLRDLSAYGHVTSLDGRPTWREKLRIKWLRWTRGLSVGGAGVKSSAAANLGQELTILALRTTAKAAGVTIGLSLMATAVIALLAWLGYAEWAARKSH